MPIRYVLPGQATAPVDTAEKQRQRELMEEADQLYATYGKPLEQEHWGKFLAVSPDGRTILGEDLNDVSREAVEQLGLGNFLFKVGEVVVGKIR